MDYLLFVKVRLGNIICLDKYITYPGAKLNYGRKTWSNHVDFVLCEANTSIFLAIELDDPTHGKPDRIARDEFVNKSLLAAGITFYCFDVRNKNTFDPDTVGKVLDNCNLDDGQYNADDGNC